jgi:DNA-binding MarR family transcriptional regulator
MFVPTDPKIKELVVGLEKLTLKINSEADNLIRKETELTLTQLLILQVIIQDQSFAQEKIARMLKISQPAVSKQLNKLIEKSLVKEVKRDRRSWKVELTKTGQKEFLKAFEIYDGFCRQVFSEFSNEEKDTLQKLLNKAYFKGN